MPEENEGLVAALKSENNILKRERSKLTQESIKRKEALRDTRAQLAKLTADHQAVVLERDDYKLKATASPNTAADELIKTKQELRLLKHTEGLKTLAYSTEIGISKTVPIERIVKLIEYAPDQEEFDGKAVAAKLVALKQSDPYLFQPTGQSAQSTEGTTGTGAAPVIPGSDGLPVSLDPALQNLIAALGRGSGQIAGTAPSLTEAQLKDPRAMRAYAESHR